MKKKLLIFIFLAAGITLYGQPAVRIFAFAQESSPGTIPAGVKDENGDPVKKAAAKEIYFVFLSFRKTHVIKPVQLFIKSQAYMIQATKIRKTPVEYADNSIPNKPEKDILIAKTSNKVIELSVGEKAVPKKKSSYVQKLTKSIDVVVSFFWNKKKYFIALKKIKKLKPALNE
jgi:hypothetical protein